MSNIQKIPASSSSAEIEAFLTRARAVAIEGVGRGRLIFGLDATASRQPTWDQACHLQAQMFEEVAATGLEVQLIYYCGSSECRASSWVTNPRRLGELMSKIHCVTGHTQIKKVLDHVDRENASKKVGTLVFVGDATEEAPDALCDAVGKLGLRGVPALMFQEGDDPACERAFREIARLSGGAFARFTPGAAHELGQLLRAAAAYAAGGVKSLEARPGAGATKLLQQLK
jgi:hypothetical protein